MKFSEEEETFLWSYYEQYLTVFSTEKKYDLFWAALLQKWYHNWPAVQTLYPGRQGIDLSDTEKKIVEKHIAETTKRIKRWYRWKLNPSAVSGSRAPRTERAFQEEHRAAVGRRLTEWQMFSKHYYVSKVKLAVETEVSELQCTSAADKLRERMKILTRVTKSIYSEQPPDIVEEIQGYMKLQDESIEKAAAAAKEMKKAGDVDEDNQSPEHYNHAILALPARLESIMTELAAHTGLEFVVLFGGPAPCNGGRLFTGSVFTGRNTAGETFGTAYKRYNEVVTAPFLQFIKDIFPPEVQSARSLANQPPKLDSLVSMFPVKPTPVSSDPLAAQYRYHKDPSPEPDSIPSPAPSDMHRSTSTPPPPPSPSVMSSPASSSMSLGSSPASSCADLPPLPTLYNSNPVPLGLQEETTLPDTSESLFMMDNFSGVDFTNMAYELEAYLSGGDQNLSWMNQLTFSSSSDPFLQSLPDAMNDHPNLEPLNSDQGLPGNGLAGNQPLDLGQSHTGSINNVHSTTSHTVPPIPPIPTSRETTSAPTASFVFPAQSSATQLFNQLTTVPVTLNTLSSVSVGPPNVTPAQFHIDPHPSSINLPTHSALPASLTASQPLSLSQVPQAPQPHAISIPQPDPVTSATSTSAPVDAPTSDGINIALPPGTASLGHVNGSLDEDHAGSRRSSRPAAPSRRAEELNKIGDSSKPPPPPEPSSNRTRPEWLSASVEHLSNEKLGKKWCQCVQLWLSIEEGNPSPKMGVLPAVDCRPVEWSTWTSKGRLHHAIPTTEDPAEFGIAVMKWWHKMQPAFRHSKELMPLRTVQDPAQKNVDWSALKKKGQNGFVVALYLVCWWGMMLETQSRWGEDSSQSWNSVVDDLLLVLNAMQPKKKPAPKRKGAAEKQREGLNKRLRKSD